MVEDLHTRVVAMFDRGLDLYYAVMVLPVRAAVEKMLLELSLVKGFSHRRSKSPINQTIPQPLSASSISNYVIVMGGSYPTHFLNDTLSA